MKLYVVLLECFIKLLIIPENKDNSLFFNTTKEHFQKSEQNLFIGFGILQLMMKFKLEAEEVYQNILLHIKKNSQSVLILKAAIVL